MTQEQQQDQGELFLVRQDVETQRLDDDKNYSIMRKGQLCVKETAGQTLSNACAYLCIRL